MKDSLHSFLYIRKHESIHSRMQLLLNSILLCIPILSRSYKKHRCLLNGLPGSYNPLLYGVALSDSVHKMAIQNKIPVMTDITLLCRYY